MNLKRVLVAVSVLSLAACSGGPKGDTGEKGPAGPAGPAGAVGATGPEGPQGVAGPAGPAGADGAQGMPGADGAQGPQGMQGIQGIQGMQGAQGMAGPPGTFDPALVIANGTTAQTASFNITGTGALTGLTVTNPTATLAAQVSSTIPFTGTSWLVPILEVKNTNGAQGVGVGFGGITATGGPSQDLSLTSKGTGRLLLNYENGADVIVGSTAKPSKFTVQGVANRTFSVGDPGCGASFLGVSLFGSTMNNCTNYSMIADATSLYVNRPTGGEIHFRQNNTDEMWLDNAGSLHTTRPIESPNTFQAGSVLMAASGPTTVTFPTQMSSGGMVFLHPMTTFPLICHSAAGANSTGFTFTCYKVDGLQYNNTSVRIQWMVMQQ
ncbi:MAG: hypothetical protein QM817_30400 [Archangium sp.]